MYGKSTQRALTAWFVTAAAAAAATSRPEPWTLDVARVMQGEWWRLASGHFVHLSWRHYLSDLLALGLILWLCVRLEENFLSIAIAAILSACGVSIILLVTHPVDIYGGLSGITAGLLSFAVLRLIADQNKRVTGLVLLVAMLVKIFQEQHGISVSGVIPVWQAHCAGATAGALVSVASLKQKWQIIFKPKAERASPPSSPWGC